MRRFPTNASVDNGRLDLWLFVSDANRMGKEGRIEISSAGQNDADSFNWDLLSLDLRSGWNHLVLPFKEANLIGHPDPNALKYIRIYLFVSGETTLKIDDIKLRHPAAFDE